MIFNKYTASTLKFIYYIAAPFSYLYKNLTSVGYCVGRFINKPSLLIVTIIFIILYLSGLEGLEDIFYVSLSIPISNKRPTSKYQTLYWKVSKLQYPVGTIIQKLAEKIFNNVLLPENKYLFIIKIY